jgi:hypothetical protein
MASSVAISFIWFRVQNSEAAVDCSMVNASVFHSAYQLILVGRCDSKELAYAVPVHSNPQSFYIRDSHFNSSWKILNMLPMKK